MLEIKDLKAGFKGGEILKGVSLKVNKGEVHSIMGPNGSGKSTLSKVLVGHPSYSVSSGSVTLDGKDLLDMDPEDRATAGLFLAYQYPVEVPGVNNVEFLRMAYNAKLKSAGKEEIDPLDFEEIIDSKMKMLGMDSRFKERAVNEGFSGGEKKKNEILQMAVLDPVVSVLDEIDSGLDIDALKTVAEGVNRLRSGNNAIIVITHFPRILEYIKPDHVHVFSAGRIVKSGDSKLAHELEVSGYDGYINGGAGK
ncbi:MAG: Fe-S cluster assembly ATPase SufC [Nitrospinota bacterium]|nr:Fe-S cluster assembly ATPase SufC [Nitrospinota bacterium]